MKEKKKFKFSDNAKEALKLVGVAAATVAGTILCTDVIIPAVTNKGSHDNYYNNDDVIDL